MAMTTRQSTKTITMPSATMASATEESVPERVTQRKPEGGRFRLQVDRQTKGSYATYEAAEKVGPVIKKEHPILQVAVYDGRREREQNYRIAVSHDCFTRHPRIVTRHMSGANQLGSENRKAISRAFGRQPCNRRICSRRSAREQRRKLFFRFSSAASMAFVRPSNG